MPSPPKPVIIFDLDGTLVDTAPDLIATLNHLLAMENCSPAPERPMRTMISLGARAMIIKGFELAKQPKTDVQLDQLTERFIAHYSDHIAVNSRPFPGVIKLLDQLSARGTPMGICTNKREDLSKQLLKCLHLDHYFSAIIGVDTLAVKKPHPEHITGTIEALGGSSAHAIMIGDSETDIKAAKAANIPVIALDFGYSLEPVANFHPDAIVSHYHDLLPLLDSFLKMTNS
ncbi:MAG: phosphoglycolate phosphatase [bacterium]|nr:phosphoglycolate phosphatase [bacterium]